MAFAVAQPAIHLKKVHERAAAAAVPENKHKISALPLNVGTIGSDGWRVNDLQGVRGKAAHVDLLLYRKE
jgi:hypothetical protein